jgi:hypothetical protein
MKLEYVLLSELENDERAQRTFLGRNTRQMTDPSLSKPIGSYSVSDLEQIGAVNLAMSKLLSSLSVSGFHSEKMLLVVAEVVDTVGQPARKTLVSGRCRAIATSALSKEGKLRK